MLKKLTAILLILSLMPIMSVFAALPSNVGTLSVTHSPTYTTGEGTKTINFNNETPSDSFFCYTGSSDTAHATTDSNGETVYDGLFRVSGSSSKSHKFISGTNADGTTSTMLYIRPTANGQSRMVVYSDYTENTVTSLEYDIYFENIPDGIDWVHTSDSGNHYDKILGFGPYPSNSNGYGMFFFKDGQTESLLDIESTSAKSTYTPVEGKWYRVCMYKDADNTCRQYLKDAITGETYLYSTGNAYTSGKRQELYLYVMAGMKDGYTGTDYPIVRLDNITFSRYTAASYSPSVKKWSIANNAVDIYKGDVISATLDQPVNAADITATLTPENGDILTASVSTFVADGKCDSTLDITLPQTMESLTKYTLSLSKGSTPISDTISFTTVDAAKLPVSFVSSSIDANKTAVDPNPSVTLTFSPDIMQSTANTVTLKKSDDAAVIETEISNITDTSFTLTPKSTLSLATSYVLDFSGVTSSSGGALQGTSSLSFTTSTRRELALWQDDFESAEPGTGGLSIKQHTSDVLTTNYNAVIPYIKNGVGKNGSKGLQIVKETNSVSRPYTKEFALDDIETLYFEYKMNFASFSDTYTGTSYSGALYMWIDSTSNSSAIFRIDRASDGKYYICNTGGSTLKELSLNTWYTFVIAATKTSQTGYLYDESGALVCEASLSRTIGDDGSVYIYPVGDGSYARFDLRMDDFKVYRLSDHELELDSENSSVKDGDTGVKVGEYISLAFNQPLAKDTAASDGTITSAALYNGSTTVDAAISLGGANELRITPDEALIEGETYTIKFADTLSPLSGNASKLSDISFTLAETYPVKVTGCALSAVPASGVLNKGTDITLTLRNSGAAKSGSVIAALYSSDRLKRLVDFEIFENVTVNAAGSTTLSLTLQNGYEGVGSIEFLMYDTLDNFSPLMHSYKIAK